MSKEFGFGAEGAEMFACTSKDMADAAKYFLDAAEYLQKRNLPCKNEKIAVACIQLQLYQVNDVIDSPSKNKVNSMLDDMLSDIFKDTILEYCPPEVKKDVEFIVNAAENAGIRPKQMLDLVIDVAGHYYKEKPKETKEECADE